MISGIHFNNTAENNNALNKIEITYHQKIQIAERKHLAGDLGFNYLPGISNFFYAPIGIFNDVKKAISAFKLNDRETIRDSGVRLGQNVVAFSSATCSILSFENFFFNRFNDSTILALTRYSRVFGLILCFLEGVFEITGIGRQWRFHHSPHICFARFLKKHKETVDSQPYVFIQELRKRFSEFFPSEPKSPREKTEIEDTLRHAIETQSFFLRKIYAENLQLLSSVWLARSFATTYFDGKDAAKVVALQKRVGVLAAKDLDSRLIKLAQDLHLSNSDKAKTINNEILRTFEKLDEQSLKKLFIHALGIFAVVITGAGIALSLSTGVGAAVALSLFLVGNFFTLSRYLITKYVFNQDAPNSTFNWARKVEALFKQDKIIKVV